MINTYNHVEYIRLQSLTIKNQSKIIIGVQRVVNVNCDVYNEASSR